MRESDRESDLHLLSRSELRSLYIYLLHRQKECAVWLQAYPRTVLPLYPAGSPLHTEAIHFYYSCIADSLASSSYLNSVRACLFY